MKTVGVRIAVAVALVALGGLYFAYDLGDYLTLDALKERQHAFSAYYADHQIRTLLAFTAVYIVAGVLAVPVSGLLTLAAGLLFGVVVGTIVASLASAVGSVCSFLLARFLFRDWVHRHAGKRLARIDEGIAREGAYYVIALRMSMSLPFFLVNFAMGVTRIRARTFAWSSFLGMLPGIVLFANAGAQLGRVDRLADILSFNLLLSFVALAAFPFAIRFAVGHWRARHGSGHWEPGGER